MTPKLVVIFGGDTPEHEISLSSARAILHHAYRLGWNVLPVGVTRNGEWLVGPGALDRLWRIANPHLLPKGFTPDDDLPGADKEVRVFCGIPAPEILSEYELALPVSHGRWGEDGTLQGLLACYGLPIVGCGVTASAICFDKHLTKSVLSAAGLPVAKGIRVEEYEYIKAPEAVAAVGRETIGPVPWFVKPARGGSSLGICRVDAEDDLDRALAEAFRWDKAAVIEEYVAHRELVIGVLGRSGRHLVISPPGECIAVGPLYTYEEKYRLGNPKFTCPAEIDRQLANRARELAAEAFRLLGCSIFARIDLFLDRRTGDFIINEVNTIPGLTEVSVFPKVMRAAGFDYPALLDEMCRLARRE